MPATSLSTSTPATWSWDPGPTAQTTVTYKVHIQNILEHRRISNNVIVFWLEVRLSERFLQPNTVWQVLRFSSQHVVEYYGSEMGNFSAMTYSIHVRRRSQFYVANIIVPSIAIRSLSGLVKIRTVFYNHVPGSRNWPIYWRILIRNPFLVYLELEWKKIEVHKVGFKSPLVDSKLKFVDRTRAELT